MCDGEDKVERWSIVNIFTKVVYFLLGNSSASEFYMPTFRKTLFQLYRRVGMRMTYLPMKMEQTDSSETSAYKIQRPGITQKKAYNIQNTAKV